MTATELLRMALYALGLVALAIGAVVMVGQVRLWVSQIQWWREGRKSARETERILRGRR